MTVDHIDHVALFGGIPFANPAFTPQRLLAATSVVRDREAGQAGLTVDPLALFDPDTITRVRRNRLTQDIAATDPTDAEHAQIERALDLLRTVVPRFSPLLDIPIRFRILTNSQAISASSFAWPQHVFLGNDAFASPEQLAEQITHEMCHCWLYFMEEVAPVHTVSERVLRLPSGTSNRDVAEVLGALHVAVTLQILWTRLDAPPAERRHRIRTLEDYAEGCIALLNVKARNLLTGGGQSLAGDLVTIHRQLTTEGPTA